MSKKLEPLQPILVHLQELKIRLIVALLSLIVTTSICYTYSFEIYNFLVKPLAAIHKVSPHKLIFTGLTEAFFMHLKLALFGGFILSFPIFAYQIYAFAAPGLYGKEKKAVRPYFISAPILFLTGAVMVYCYVMPLAWSFFISFEQIGNSDTMPIILEARVSEYLSLVISLVLGFGLAFQLPIILILLTQIGLTNGKWLADKRRYAIVIIFIAAAILTPPDVISQIALAIPLLLLYEISVLICKRIDKNKVIKND